MKATHALALALTLIAGSAMAAEAAAPATVPATTDKPVVSTPAKHKHHAKKSVEKKEAAPKTEAAAPAAPAAK